MRIRIVSSILLSLMIFGIMFGSTHAAETKGFILVVESEGNLVAAPEYISYKSGQTIKSALAESNHTFTGIDADWITAVDDVTGNFKISDENGAYDLSGLASEIKVLRFSDEENVQPSSGLVELMKVMADYLLEESDVKAAAKNSYETALAQFVGLDSESAKTLAKGITDSVSSYKSILNGKKYDITFSDGRTAYSNAEIFVENAYGKVWTDENKDGILTVPKGIYNFQITQDGNHVTGTVNVTKNLSVTAAIPKESWLNTENFRLSASYNLQNSEEQKFADEEFVLPDWENRQITIPVLDTFTGSIYSYAEYQNLTELPILTTIYQDADTGERVEARLPFESYTSGLMNVLNTGETGNSVTYRISQEGENGYIYAQDYVVHFERIPSLSGISVSDQAGTDQAATEFFDEKKNSYTYKVLSEVISVNVEAEPFFSEYTVKINGQVSSGEKVRVPLNQENGASVETDIEIEVLGENYKNVYFLKILPGEGQQITFLTKEKGVDVQVTNKNGMVMPCKKVQSSDTLNRYVYVLVAEDEYQYIGTKDTYFHSKNSFTLDTLTNQTVVVDVPTEHWLDALAMGSSSTITSKGNLLLEPEFQTDQHKYQIRYIDTEHNAYTWVSSTKVSDIQAIYTQNYVGDTYHGQRNQISLVSGASGGVQLKRMLMDENPIENSVVIRLSKENDGITYYQDYEVEFKRTLTLKNISAKCDGSTASLVQQNSSKTGFKPHITEYSVTVPMAARTLSLEAAAYHTNKCYGETNVGYQIFLDGIEVTQLKTLQIPLNGTIETQDIKITVKNDKAPEGSTDYIIHILKSPPIDTFFDLEPKDAQLSIYENLSGERLWEKENGAYQLCEGFSYDYTLTNYQFVSKQGTLTVTRDTAKNLIVKDGEQSYEVLENGSGGGEIHILWTLKRAEINEKIDTTLQSQWPDFRGNSTNNAVTDVKIPMEAEQGTLYWANKLGEGFDSGAVGSPIIVNNELITYAGDKIFRVDRVTGEIIKEGAMDHRSSFSITPPVYAEGMIFVALSNGSVQAFDAVTLESLWLYMDPLGGQPNCPLTVKDGYLYTGFWNSETGKANFICLSITDEDPDNFKEGKCAAWYYTQKGGFYWAGAYVNDDYVLVGTDDGTNTCTNDSSSMLMFEPKTGKLLDRWDKLNGDIRSTVVYDDQTDAFYFTSKGGSFYSFKAIKTKEGFKISDQWSVALQNGSESTAMSTCSPVVYNQRAYVGVSGSSQFGDYSGHNLTVIDLNKKKIAYQAETQGYPQTSGLLSKAYGEYVYVYFFDNATPGKLRVLRDKKGQTSADYLTMEEDYETVYALFTPTGKQAQYAICSPIVDEYGTIYFKNDSAHLMAFGNAVKKIEITKMPDQTSYVAGAVFNPEGMIVTATYANGMTRDITDYITYSKNPLTKEDTEFTISFEHVMYHNAEKGTAMQSGVVTVAPTATLKLSFHEKMICDVDQDGKITVKDAQMILEYEAQNRKALPDEMIADVSGDGVIDSNDAVLILQYLDGKITLEEIKGL